MDEHELWRDAQSGDGAAREQLCRLARELAERELLRRGVRPGEVADLAQESVRSTLVYLAGGTPPRDLRAFLRFRAWGILSDHRKHARAQRVEFQDLTHDEHGDPRPGPEAPSLRDEIERALAECRAALDRELYLVLEQRYELRRETEAIARELGIHRNTVAVRVFRALELLRDCLRRKGFAPGEMP